MDLVRRRGNGKDCTSSSYDCSYTPAQTAVAVAANALDFVFIIWFFYYLWTAQKLLRDCSYRWLPSAFYYMLMCTDA